jgi:putative copper export protein
VLAPGLDALRLSLHVLAATIWVGGQYTLAGLVPALRRQAPGALRPAARQFARLAWPAFVVLVGTGLWNIAADPPAHQSGPWRAVLWAKIAVVALSGTSAFVHQRSRRPAGLAVWGALSSLSALAALVLGVLLAG